MTGICRACSRPIITGLDDETAGLTARCEPYRISAHGEVAALRAGRWTWALLRGRLERRDRWSIPGHPPEDGTVLAEHSCDHPPPDDWLAPPLPRSAPAPTTPMEF